MIRVTTARIWSGLLRADPFVLISRLTLVTVLVNARGSAAELVVAVLATVLLFLRPDRMRMAWPWLALAAALGTLQLTTWWRPDDHVVATTYWVAALGLSRLANRPDGVQQTTARLLVGVIFGFAVGWKLLSSQYVSNDFFRYMLAWDGRFEHVAEASGTDLDALRESRAQAIESTFIEATGTTATLPEGARTSEVAWVLTIWGVAVEAAVALLHLSPLPERLQRARPLSVFVFCATTYAVLPVVGFALLLLTLTAAQSRSATVRATSVVLAGAIAVWGWVFSSAVA